MLEDSNQIISSYEKENDDLKEKNVKSEQDTDESTISWMDWDREGKTDITTHMLCLHKKLKIGAAIPLLP